MKLLRVIALLLLLLTIAIPAAPQSGVAQGNVGAFASINVSYFETINSSDFVITAIPLDRQRIRLDLRSSDQNNGAGIARLGLKLRSNAPYKLEIKLLETSGAAKNADLLVKEIKAGGQRTNPLALANSIINPVFTDKTENNFASLNQSATSLLNGPRISLGGGLLAASNALEVELVWQVNPQMNQAWSAGLELIIAAQN